MKNFYLAALLVSMCFSASAQEYKARAPKAIETRRVAGVQNYIQDEFTRRSTPVFVLNSLLYLSTNATDGMIFVRSNATVLVHIGLPNPTNNTGRKYEVTTMGAATAVLTNWYVTGTFTSNNSMAEVTGYFIASNKTAVAYSTGTNWLVRGH
jgi:hypothetical protein